jgi:uncharacterized protein
MIESRPSVVIDTSRSKHARLSSVPVGAVELTGSFWGERRRVLREVTLPAMYSRLEETGRIDNFRRASGKRPDLPYQGAEYNDSDVYKWVEAAAWTLAGGPDPRLEGLVDGVIDEIAAAQEPDGYLDTFFTFQRAGERWTNFAAHEMYCAGHLFQAAVAHYRSTGSGRLLDVAVRLADYLDRTFGPEEQGKRVYADGHEEVEMALVELYRATGERRYLDLARFFVDVRGHGLLRHPRVYFDSVYFQDDRPFNEMDALAGHAVRALYYCCAAADIYSELGDPGTRAALERLWQNMLTRRMYVTGGLGSRYDGEAFGGDFELPNQRAHTETCAAVAAVMWNHRMLALEGEARFADLLEHTLYNAALPGISLGGDEYFYQNPLADDGDHRRQTFFHTACCPPNIARLLASLPGYFYSTSADGIWVHLYGENRAEITLSDGRQVRLEQQTAYPWHEDVTLRISGEGEFSLFLRVPAWCESGARLWVNDESWSDELAPGGYATVRRRWQPGDRLRLHLPMPVRKVRGHPYIFEDRGRLALMRGPLVYCVEGADYPGLDVRDLVLPGDAPLGAEEHPDLLGGVVLLHGTARLLTPGPSWRDKLYSGAPPAREAGGAEVPFVALPYYAWANREPGGMQVWLRAQE